MTLTKHAVVPLLLLALPLVATATDEWTGSGELGLAISRGNSQAENLNAKLSMVNESDDWTHKFGFSALRARNRISGVTDEDGITERHYELSANRYQLTASSAYKMNARASWVGALRYENDDFAAFDHQTTFSLGFGYRFLDSERTKLSTEVGPGYRRAQRRSDGDIEGDIIFRGLVDFRHMLTGNTALTNSLLVESGADNTFAQNEFGLSVAMNDRLALKAGLQLRHNTDVEPGTYQTDTLSTVNLVYTLK